MNGTTFENMTINILARRENITERIQAVVDELEPLASGNGVDLNTMRKYTADVDNLITAIRREKGEILKNISDIQGKFNLAVKDALKLGEKSVVDLFLYSNNGKVTTDEVKALRQKFQKRFGVAGDIVMKSDSIPILEMNSSLGVIKSFVNNLEGVNSEVINNLLKDHDSIRKGVDTVTKHAQSVTQQLFNTAARLKQRVQNGRLPKEVGPLITRLQAEGTGINSAIKTKVGVRQGVNGRVVSAPAVNANGRYMKAQNGKWVQVPRPQMLPVTQSTTRPGNRNVTGRYVRTTTGWSELKPNVIGKYMKTTNGNGRIRWVPLSNNAGTPRNAAPNNVNEAESKNGKGSGNGNGSGNAKGTPSNNVNTGNWNAANAVNAVNVNNVNAKGSETKIKGNYKSNNGGKTWRSLTNNDKKAASGSY